MSAINRLRLFVAALVMLTSVTATCSPDEEARASYAISRLREYKADGLEILSITTEENRVKVEGYATAVRRIIDFQTMIGNKIGYPQITEILQAERNGQRVSHFVIEVVPRFGLKAPPSFENTSSFVKVYSSEDSSAWYLNLEFTPFGKTIRGIPVRQIDITWCAANEFEQTLFPVSTYTGNYGLNEILKNGRSFSISGKFDGTRLLTALVGIYQKCDGRNGTFVLVIDKANRANPVVFLYQFEQAFFSYLLNMDKSTFSIWDCIACDSSTTFHWNNSYKMFTIEP